MAAKKAGFGVYLLSVLILFSGCQMKSANDLAQRFERTSSLMNSAIYVQTAEGSFNHQALNCLYQYEHKPVKDYRFSGTPMQTFQNAAENKSQAFVALRNDLIPGNLVNATVDAIKLYRVVEVTAGVSLPVEMCLLRTRHAIEQKVPLMVIASHPAALAQIGRWKSDKALREVEELQGTSVAGRRLAAGEYSEDTAAIGSCVLANLYSNLVVAESGIQDRNNNRTLFGRLRVEKRKCMISEKQAREELWQIVDKAKKLSEWSD